MWSAAHGSRRVASRSRLRSIRDESSGQKDRCGRAAALTEDDPQDIGVSAVGDRRRLLDAIAALASATPTEAPRGAPHSAPPKMSQLAAECRPITVMFCDLVGSTSLAAKLDAEDWRCSAIQKRKRTPPNARCGRRFSSSARFQRSTPGTPERRRSLSRASASIAARWWSTRRAKYLAKRPMSPPPFKAYPSQEPCS
jgi:hypothetical protein